MSGTDSLGAPFDRAWGSREGQEIVAVCNEVPWDV